MAHFIFPFSIIFFSLVSGYAFNRAIEIGLVHMSVGAAEKLRRGMQKFAMLAVNPVAFCGAVWVIDLSENRYFMLPFIGLSALATGLLLGIAGKRLLVLPPARAGVYAASGSFTNIGNIGGLVVFLLLGEAAFALLPFYKLFEELWYYSVIFPMSRAYGERANPDSTRDRGRPGRLAGALRVVRDPFLLVALSAVVLGLGLNASGVVRPAFYGRLNSILVPFSSFLLLFAIGMRMKFRIPRRDRKPAIILSVGKVTVVPFVATGIALLLGLGHTAGGLGLKVVMVLAAMPVGFLSLVPPALYDLDQDFAGSIWLTSNAAVLVVTPVLAIILNSGLFS
ncbi:MAG: hypothetical protein CVV51_06900 [Spirochaetae bacterium HGW-Spirochaetae-7]|jgi:hypothetical protein|nr:MAG: hypothetical protein CVV51_06900 [Spirochaetae bacterium HGW-Spirochaetae-7]